jgi:hypothetical protein
MARSRANPRRGGYDGEKRGCTSLGRGVSDSFRHLYRQLCSDIIATTRVQSSEHPSRCWDVGSRKNGPAVSQPESCNSGRLTVSGDGRGAVVKNRSPGSGSSYYSCSALRESSGRLMKHYSTDVVDQDGCLSGCRSERGGVMSTARLWAINMARRCLARFEDRHPMFGGQAEA